MRLLSSNRRPTVMLGKDRDRENKVPRQSSRSSALNYRAKMNYIHNTDFNLSLSLSPQIPHANTSFQLQAMPFRTEKARKHPYRQPSSEKRWKHVKIISERQASECRRLRHACCPFDFFHGCVFVVVAFEAGLRSH